MRPFVKTISALPWSVALDFIELVTKSCDWFKKLKNATKVARSQAGLGKKGGGMKNIRRVVVCGPPHSGKSVFLANLQRLLPVEHHMLIFGAPDGEWHWSNQADQGLVKNLREKKKFSVDWCGRIVSAIASAEQRLVLVDTGGKRLPPNDEIFSSSDGFIIISSSPEEVIEWRKYGESFGCQCLAELDSVLEGTQELCTNRGDGIIRGRICGLERGTTVESPALRAVANRLCEVIEANAEMTEGEMLANINGAKLVDHLRITDQSDPYLGVRPWHTAPALRLTAVARRLETVRIWNVRASFMTCAFATALPGNVELLGVSEGYVPLPEVVPTGDGSGNGLDWETTEQAEYTLVEYRKRGFFTREMLASVVPPIVNPRKGVVLSTDGPPIWLDATIARSYQKVGAPWIAVFVPVESGRVQPSLDGRKWGDARPQDGPCVVIHGPENRLGEIVPVPIALLKWQGGGRHFSLGSGEPVVDRPNSHLATHGTVLPFVGEALRRIQSGRREFIAEEVDFGEVVGQTICVETRESDNIVFAQRPNRSGLTRFVKGREPEPCSTVVVCLKRAREGGYILLTAYIGRRTPAEPWDTEWATEQSVPFWKTHALIFGHEQTIPGTETKNCPW